MPIYLLGFDMVVCTMTFYKTQLDSTLIIEYMEHGMTKSLLSTRRVLKL